MTRGLFINNKRANDSIFESGLMAYNCLRLSAKYQLDYQEVSEQDRIIPGGYDFYFLNYHPSTMSWMKTTSLQKQLPLCITMVLEILPGDPFVHCPDNHFDAYCVLDPTIDLKRKDVFAFPRPLEAVDSVPVHIPNEVPVIGTFGFATKGKGFQHVVEAVNKEFDKAIVRINIPYGDFVPDSDKYAAYLGQVCRDKAKEGIEVVVTHEYMTKAELIGWCAQNTLNCFLYDRNLPGLAATTDQAIVAERPLSVSHNDTFRHITQYISPYPQRSLRASIEESIPEVKKMKGDWSPQKFAERFEMVLEQCLPLKRKADAKSITLPVLTGSFSEKISKKIRKYKRRLNWQRIKAAKSNRNKPNNEELI